MASASSNGNGKSGVSSCSVELRSIPLSQIVIRDGFNPRGEVVEDSELKTLAATMRERGCLQPVRLRAGEGGEYELIAGERRYRAAALAGLTELPASIVTGALDDDDLIVEAIIENELRSDLDALQRARGYKAMKDSGLGIRAIAEQLGGKTQLRSRERRIKEHLAILSLPESLRVLVAEQKIPMLAVGTLVELAAIHEQFAHAAVAAVLECEDEADYTWQEVIDSPIAVAVDCMEDLPEGIFSSHAPYPIERFSLNQKAQKNLAAYRRLTDGAEIGFVRFGDELLAQARALGAVRDVSWYSLVLGQDVADQLAEDYIARVLKERRAAERNAGASQDADGASGSRASGNSSSQGPRDQEGEADRAQREDEEKRAKRAEEQERREEAISFNLALGILAFRYLPKIKIDERVLRILASVDLGGSLREITMRGARLALPAWVTQSAQRNGKTKTTYLDTWEAERKALEFLAGAQSAGEIAGRAITLIALASLVDEEGIAQSKRSFHTLSFGGAWAEQASRDLNAIVRERIAHGQLASLDELLAERIASDEREAAREIEARDARLRIEDACARLSELNEEELDQLLADGVLGWGEFSPQRFAVRDKVEGERSRRNAAADEQQAEPEAVAA